MYSSMTSAASHSLSVWIPVLVTQPLERLGQRLSRNPVEAEGERIDGGCDEVGSRLDRRQRRRDAEAGRALHVEAHGEPARLANPRDELLRLVREAALPWDR